jgi:hypothetical protein
MGWVAWRPAGSPTSGCPLAAAEFAGCSPPVLTALGLLPADLGTGYGLSPLTTSRIDALVDRALVVLSTWGCSIPAQHLLP